MPRTDDRNHPEWMVEARREIWRGTGDAWTLVSDLIAATAVWGAIGFGLDRWLGTGPVLLLVGAVAGHIAGIYLVFRKGQQISARAQSRKGASKRER